MSLKPPTDPNTPLGTGRVYYNVVTDGGARGNGTYDDSTVIQNTIDAAHAAGGGIVFFPRGTYKLGTTLTLSSNVHLLGSPGATLDASTTTKSGSARRGIYANGSTGSPVLLASNATAGTYSFDVVDASGLSAGDWVVVATSGTNYYNYGDGVTHVDRGEIKRIFSVSGSTLTFEQALYDGYTVANAAFIKKITFVENIAVEGLKILGSNTAGDGGRGIELSWVNGFRITACEFQDIDVYSIFASSSIRGSIIDNRFRGTYYDGITGTSFYAVAIYNASQWIRVSNNHAERVRHLFVNSSNSAGQSVYGQPRHITVTSNVAQFMQSNGAGSSWAFEHHGFGENIVISDNTIDGCYGGFVTRGPGVRFENNVIRNWTDRAIELHSDMAEARDISIKNNTISSTAAGGTPVAIRGDLSVVTRLQNLVIEGNEIEVAAADIGRQGAAITIIGAISAPGLIIRNNTITTLDTPTTYPVWVVPNYATITGNRIIGSGYGFLIRGTDQVVTDNRTWISAVPASGIAFFTDTANNYIARNEAINPVVGFRLAIGATGSMLVNNATSGASDANGFNILETSPGRITGNVKLDETTSFAAAATLTLPTGNGDSYTITGNTGITSITASRIGRRVTLTFTGTPTVTDGSNLKIAGNFVATADDTLTLVCDGTNWFEVARSVN